MTLLAFTAWCASPALAFNEHGHLSLGSGNPAHVASGSVTGTIVRTIIGLLVVIAVIYGITWALKQSRASRNPALGDGLAQVASLPLGPGRSVALVRVGAELHMLGVAEHGISGLRVFSEEEAYELGIPFDTEESEKPVRARGQVTAQGLIDALRRSTIR